MSSIKDIIADWFQEILIGIVNANLTTMFDDVNEKVGTIAEQVGKAPQDWNVDIFNMIKSLSNNVIIPIAGIIITFVLCYELISMITEKNNMHDVDTFMFFKYFFKMWVAVYLVTHTFDITMAIFDLGQYVVNQSAGVITSTARIDISSSLQAMSETMESMGIGELAQLVLETTIVSICMKILAVIITVIVYGRMIEIYLYSSVSPIPFATMTNREWGSIGTNYLKGLIALGMQGFFIMVCMAIYAVLVQGIVVSEDIHASIWMIAAYTILLGYSLFKTGSLSKSIFHAH